MALFVDFDYLAAGFFFSSVCFISYLLNFCGSRLFVAETCFVCIIIGRKTSETTLGQF